VEGETLKFKGKKTHQKFHGSLQYQHIWWKEAL